MPPVGHLGLPHQELEGGEPTQVQLIEAEAKLRHAHGEVVVSDALIRGLQPALVDPLRVSGPRMLVLAC
eukprot:6988548-Pyramimonas_sp.AAC.1